MVTERRDEQEERHTDNFYSIIYSLPKELIYAGVKNIFEKVKKERE